MTEMIVPTSMHYFYGWITREKSESILQAAGCPSGMYLLRESNSKAGQYVLSLCHNNRVHHYSIERQPSGCVKIQDGISFPGPVELVNHHKKNVDGLLTKLTIPCDRPPEMQVMAWPNVTYLELEEQLLRKAKKMGLKNAKLCNAFSHQRQHLQACVAQELHLEQPWFHGCIERAQADEIMNQIGHCDGKFLVREKKERSGYVLCLSYKNETKHYKIDRIISDKEKLAIENGPRFDNLMDMIAHYHNKTQGLLCKLSTWYESQDWQRRKEKKLSNLSKNMDTNCAYAIVPAHQTRGESSPSSSFPSRSADSGIDRMRLVSTKYNGTPQHNGFTTAVGSDGWDSDNEDAEAEAVTTGHPDYRPCHLDSITASIFNMDRKNLELHNNLGCGNFGTVIQGTYQIDYDVIPVAIKILKKDHLGSGAEKDIMKEAEVMSNLRHDNILRMYGVCRSDTLMLVLELAPCGPLHKYLKTHKSMPLSAVIELMLQVAKGMAYLETGNFVHRDLAARNVLLVRPDLAKISDFGMSKALGHGTDYYKASSAGKWPLKWYAPECIYYFKFDAKSDVWSYGVTMWEATTYGEKPYKRMKGYEILNQIDAGYRLEQPFACPNSIYEIMLKCWEYEKEKRPTFDMIVNMLLDSSLL